MRGAKVRSADTIDEWSVALVSASGPGGLLDYIDQGLATKLDLVGGIMTGPLLLASNAINNLAAVPLQQLEAGLTSTLDTLVGDAPLTMNTIYKLADVLLDDPTIIQTLVDTKANLSGGATFTGPIVVPGTTSVPGEAVNFGNVTEMIDAVPTVVFDPANYVDTPSGVGGAAIRTINLSETGVVAATYTKVAVDVYGRVTAGEALLVTDLPSVDVGGSLIPLADYLLQLGGDIENYALKAGDIFTGGVDVADLFRVNTTLTPDNTVEILPPVGGVMSSAGIFFRLSGAVVQGVKVLDDYQLVAEADYVMDPLEPKAVVLQSHLTAALAAVVDGAEDSWVSDGITLSYPFTNIQGAAAFASPGRVMVFVDGVYQSSGNYVVQVTGIEFATAPPNLSDIDARHIN